MPKFFQPTPDRPAPHLGPLHRQGGAGPARRHRSAEAETRSAEHRGSTWRVGSETRSACEILHRKDG